METPVSRIRAAGDVPGCNFVLQALVNQRHLSCRDHGILLGDVVEWGRDPRRHLEMVVAAGRFCRSDLVTGNHEQDLLDPLPGPVDVQGRVGWGDTGTLMSNSGHAAGIPSNHLDHFATELPCVATDKVVCVNADIELDALPE